MIRTFRDRETRDIFQGQDRLHALTGDREGQWAIWINRQYRICFEWRDGDAWNVEITDYH